MEKCDFINSFRFIFVLLHLSQMQGISACCESCQLPGKKKEAPPDHNAMMMEQIQNKKQLQQSLSTSDYTFNYQNLKKTTDEVFGVLLVKTWKFYSNATSGLLSKANYYHFYTML